MPATMRWAAFWTWSAVTLLIASARWSGVSMGRPARQRPPKKRARLMAVSVERSSRPIIADLVAESSSSGTMVSASPRNSAKDSSVALRASLGRVPVLMTKTPVSSKPSWWEKML